MLEVFFGNDIVTVRQKAFTAAEDKLVDGVVLEVIDADNYVPGIYADAAGGTSLFGEEKLYVIDTPSQKKDWYEDTTAQVALLAESKNTFIIIETTLLAAEKKKFAKFATTLEECKAGPAERYDFFALTDALARKDKKSLWLLLMDSQREGIPVEEIVGMLWWQLKTMRLASLTQNAAEAGMKDFPYNKAKRALSAFKEGELERLSHELITIQHESRLGKRELDLALEQWVLTL